jgi:hypothetical protein
MYPRQPYIGVDNPLWGQPNTMGILQQGTFPFQSIKPMIPTQQSIQTQCMVGPSGQPQYMEGPSNQSQYVGCTSI